MTFTFHGLIGTRESMLSMASNLGIDAFALTETLAVIPFGFEFIDQLGPSLSAAEPEGMDMCHSKIFAAMVESIGLDPFVYAEAAFWGGEGEQAAMVIKDGEVVWSRDWGPPSGYPVDDTDENRTHISEALRRIGVETGEHIDAFDAVNLGRYRQHDKWLEQPPL